MADLTQYLINLETPQPGGRKGESPRAAFTKYNDLVARLGGMVDYVSDTEPSVTHPGMTWIDMGQTPPMLRRRSAGDDSWIDIGPAFVPFGSAAYLSEEEVFYRSRMIGEAFFLRDDLVGVVAPPTDNAKFRFIKLTASDPYNAGVLTDESVTGAAPLVVATAVISLPGSPINGRTINLWNTERRNPRAGRPGFLEQDAVQEMTGHINASTGGNSQALFGSASGVFVVTSGSTSPVIVSTDGPQTRYREVSFAASREARTDHETRVKNQGVTYYMRIL